MSAGDTLSRRELLAGAGAGAAALLLEGRSLEARVVGERDAPSGGRNAQTATTIFTNTTVANPDSVANGVALVVEGQTIVAVGPSDEIVAAYPRAQVYDGRGKALIPGLINCHAHCAPSRHGGRW